MFQKYKYHASLLAAALCYAGISVFAAILTRQQIDAFTQIQWRAFFGAVTSLIILKFIQKKDLSVNRKEFFYIVLNSFLFVGGFTTFIVSIYLGTPIAKADALLFTYPLTVVLFSYIFLKDRPTGKQLVATVISLTSAMVLLEIWKVKSITKITAGEALALINSGYYSAIIILGRIIRIKTKLAPLKTISYSLFLLIPQLWILGFILNQVFGIQTLKPYFTLNLPLISWFTLLASGFISTTLPINFLYLGLRKVKPNIASLLLVTELAWVSILGFILFGQTLTGWGILGIIGITLAVLLV